MKKIDNTECWKDIVGYEGKYQVSDLGNVRSLNYKKTGKTKVLKPKIYRDGYYQVQPSKNGKSKKFLVHRLIFTTFKGPIPPGMTVDHVNGCKTDNRLENLQLLTRGDNARKGNLGKKLSEETRAKMCKPHTAETKAKISQSQKGKKLSEETKAKISAAQKARFQRESSGIIKYIM